MLRPPGRPRAWLPGGRLPRPVTAGLALLAAAAAVVLPAGPAWADHVRDQQQWVLDAVHAPAAWQVTQGRGVTVAVIDSGVNPRVSDLAGSVRTGPDLTGVHTPSSNHNWGTHGTWMAALIAGHGHGPGGSSGIIGVAPQARILSIRVVADAGDPAYRRYQKEPGDQVQQALAKAIRYAAGHRAAVISMSLGYGTPSLPVREALQFALDQGTAVVASAGNSGDRATARNHGQAPYSFPAEYPGVLGVGAVAQDGATAAFSSANLSVGVAAPGVMVPTQGRDGKYWYVNGTSPACALAAGVAALIKSRYPALPPSLVSDAITASTASKPAGGYNDQVGFGTVDAAAALATAGRLAAGSSGRGAPGVGTAAHFGGGTAAVPAPPVPPRSGARLLAFGALAILFLGGAALASRWVARSRRDPPLPAAPGTVAGASAYPGEWADAWPAPPGPARAAAAGPVGVRRWPASTAGNSHADGASWRTGAARPAAGGAAEADTWPGGQWPQPWQPGQASEWPEAQQPAQGDPLPGPQPPGQDGPWPQPWQPGEASQWPQPQPPGQGGQHRRPAPGR